MVSSTIRGAARPRQLWRDIWGELALADDRHAHLATIVVAEDVHR